MSQSSFPYILPTLNMRYSLDEKSLVGPPHHICHISLLPQLLLDAIG